MENWIRAFPALYILFACPSICFTQSLPNQFFQNPQTSTCIYDNQTSIVDFAEWTGFQTRDSTYWGPHDSLCFDIADLGSSGVTVDFSEINPTLPLYIRNNLDSSNMVLLDSNNLYVVHAWF
ncbi:MAG: hypothetical protein AAF570_25365, partial [Bacteroidota bacterium]